jgi:hypothetical protein
METIILATILILFLKFLNSMFDYKRRVRSYFDSIIGYRAFNTFVFLLLFSPIIYISGAFFSVSDFYFVFFCWIVVCKLYSPKNKIMI